MGNFITDDDCRIHFEPHGFDGDGPVIVFLNGMTQSTAHWRSQGRKFGESFRVLTYDARGQGESQIGDEPLTLSLHADDLADLLTKLDVETAHLVGFSHGARIALAFANEHPDRLDRLVLCSATASPRALARTVVRGWKHILELGGLEAMSWAALPAILGEDYLEANEEIIDGIVNASVERNDRAGVEALLDAMIDYPELSDLAGGVDAPTLVISADEDPLVSEAGARELAKLCGGEYRLVEGVGHTVPIEAPDVFREIVIDFLRM